MQHISFVVKALLVLSTAMAFMAGCDDSIEFSNTPPGGLSITRDKCNLATGNAVRLTGHATDPDGDPITFSWWANAGAFEPPDGKGRVVTWTAPDQHGVYRVVLKASDGIGETTRGIDIAVGPRVPAASGLIVLEQTEYPYYIEGDAPLEIDEGAELRVGPGVTVIVNRSGGGLLVKGRLNVEGTAQKRVVFKPNTCPGEHGIWSGIEFEGEMASGELHYMSILKAETALSVQHGAYVEGVGLDIEGCVEQAVAIVDSGVVAMEGSRIRENKRGIYVEDGVLHLSGSVVRDNETYGIYLISSSYDGPFAASVEASAVTHNIGNGIVLSQYADPVINGNAIFFNESVHGTGYALMLTAYSGDITIDATGNFWGVVTEEQVIEQIYLGTARARVDYSGWLYSSPIPD